MSRSDIVVQSVSSSAVYVHVFVARRWKRIFDPFPSLDAALDFVDKYKKDHPPPETGPKGLPSLLRPEPGK